VLRWLHDDGVTLDELRAAVGDGRLALLPAELALGVIGTMTPEDVAAEVGVDIETLEAVWRASGLPLPPRDCPELGELDMFGARALAAFIDGGLPVEGLIEASRVFGEAAAHAAAAAGTLANASIPQAGDTEYEYARRLGIATRELTPYAAELLGVMYMLHNRENIRQEMVAAEEIVAGRRSDLHEVADYYGGPVNLAARLTERARPSALIADAAVRELAGDEAFAWSDAGLKKLKGISEPLPVFRCRRAGK
jgi:hypothetical protein